ncbi:MAG TPA: aminotransferase class V-fold PLP-dependent enzyme [Bryobacteraceae bacterium]|nr:aminotransferase class V-fold PLP-dependent enzyme [Bryobacteraceae bacterium]
MSYRPGRHFLQIPGPTNVPDRVLRAIDHATIDHRSCDFAELARACLDGMKSIFQTPGPVVIFPSSGTGAWEAALVNTMSAGDKVLVFETGHFSTLWTKMARNLGLSVDVMAGDWRHGADAARLEERLKGDSAHEIRAVMVVHNETSTGTTSNIPAVRKAINAARHPALLLVDTISSLACMEYRHEEWGVDVTVGGSQKGLMLPPGLGFNAMSAKAIEAGKKSRLPKSFFQWGEMLEANAKGFFPYTPSTNLLYGLREALRMLEEEGIENVFKRHARLAEATRRAARAWGLEMVPLNCAEYSNSLTALFVPEGFNEATLRALILERFNMSLGAGLGKLDGRAFRIGHLGDFNELMLAGTLAGVEMGLELAGIPHGKGGVDAALQYLVEG